MSVISDLLLVSISLLGLGYIVSGKPRSKKVKCINNRGDVFVYKSDNFAKKMLKFFLLILGLYILGSIV